MPRIDRPRIAAEEAPHDRIVLPRAQVVLRGGGVVALAGVQIRGNRIGDGLQQITKGSIVIRLNDCAARVGQGADAALDAGKDVWLEFCVVVRITGCG